MPAISRFMGSIAGVIRDSISIEGKFLGLNNRANLMAPEAYVLESAIGSWIAEKPGV